MSRRPPDDEFEPPAFAGRSFYAGAEPSADGSIRALGSLGFLFGVLFLVAAALATSGRLVQAALAAAAAAAILIVIVVVGLRALRGRR